MRQKILNLYAGIGGNRKLWTDCDITAVEHNPQIAEIYQDFFPADTVVVGDAHQYLLEHYAEFDFIWSSPPCPTHSAIRYAGHISGKEYQPAVYPDMVLYQEIIFLQHYAKLHTKWVVENVTPFYDYLIQPSFRLQRHPFWSNFQVAQKKFNSVLVCDNDKMDDLAHFHGFDLSVYKIENKKRLLRNCVFPPIGEYILNQARQRPAPATPSMQLALMG